MWRCAAGCVVAREARRRAAAGPHRRAAAVDAHAAQRGGCGAQPAAGAAARRLRNFAPRGEISRGDRARFASLVQRCPDDDVLLPEKAAEELLLRCEQQSGAALVTGIERLSRLWDAAAECVLSLSLNQMEDGVRAQLSSAVCDALQIGAETVPFSSSFAPPTFPSSPSSMPPTAEKLSAAEEKKLRAAAAAVGISDAKTMSSKKLKELAASHLLKK